jgi:hypothetical protein
MGHLTDALEKVLSKGLTISGALNVSLLVKTLALAGTIDFVTAKAAVPAHQILRTFLSYWGGYPSCKRPRILYKSPRSRRHQKQETQKAM